MLKHSSLLFGATLLTGCTNFSNTTQEELSNLHAQQIEQSSSIKSIKQKQDGLSKTIENVNGAVEIQFNYIQSLEQEIVNLNSVIQQLSDHVAKLNVETSVKSPKPTRQSESSELPSNVLILGAVEKVEVESIKKEFNTRIDTGATTSSLSAKEIKAFERDGNKWVRFLIADDSISDNESLWIEAPLIRYAHVKQSNSDLVERRPVVEQWIKLGSNRFKAQFTLTDRSHMSHPILIGREFIKDIAIVDVSKQYLQSK
jgi:hypothetical protein